MVRIDYRTKKISPILITLLVIGLLMLVTGAVMLSHYSSSEATAAPDPPAKGVLPTPSALQVTESVINPGEIGEATELSDSKTTEPESTTQCGCGCGGNSAISEPETEVPSCCGG